jgi:4-amino-4-deoxy-L-arabinose transferase-like glycosyltransferase
MWLIPAVIVGGDTYRNDLLWGHTANRVVAAFAHQRPLWWYFSLLPVFFFPWFFVKAIWSGMAGLKHDSATRFLMIWIGSTLLLISNSSLSPSVQSSK